MHNPKTDRLSSQQRPAKVWRQRPTPPAGFAEMMRLSPFQAHLLFNRGVKRPEGIEDYLAADSRLAHDPRLLPDVDKAVTRLNKALDAREVIGVFGDFDTDGIAGTAILVSAIRELGGSAVSYLPNRMDEGHGLNREAVVSLHKQGVSLLVTVDCGISDVSEVRLASALGIDTIITDHHSLPDIPPNATAIVNPRRPESQYPYDDLTGSGISFKLAGALYDVRGRGRPNYLFEMAALGTVADVAPLTGENRYIVKVGLECLNLTQHPGLKALIARSGIAQGSLDTESLSFTLIPRLNAAGRIGDPDVSLRLLTATSFEEAVPLAETLEQQNYQRRQLTVESVALAQSQVELEHGVVPPVIIVEHEEWMPGILGLIAGNLSESYYRPVVAIRVGKRVSRASARSIPEFNIVEALERSKRYFSRFGGHPQAAGFTVATDDLPNIKEDLVGMAQEKLAALTLQPTIDVDCQVSPALLVGPNFDFIESLRPFGEENPAPTFLTRNARVVEARKVGAHGDHLKMTVVHDGSYWDTIAFKQGGREVYTGDGIDLVYNVGINHWGGRDTYQLNVLDFRTKR